MLFFLVSFAANVNRGAFFKVAFLLVAQDCLFEYMGDLFLEVGSTNKRFPVLFFLTVIFVIAYSSRVMFLLDMLSEVLDLDFRGI